MKSSPTFRLSCRNDAADLARLHFNSSISQPGSFMHNLGKRFLKSYYQILLDEGSSIIMMASDNNNNIIGFAAGSIDGKSRLKALNDNKLKLMLSSLPTLILKPWLINEIIMRKNDSSTDNIYVLTSGAHMDYWAWDPSAGAGSMELFKKWLSLIKILGVKKIRGEVDVVNSDILKAHQILGAKIIDKYITPDGRKRKIIEYNLSIRDEE